MELPQGNLTDTEDSKRMVRQYKVLMANIDLIISNKCDRATRKDIEHRMGCSFSKAKKILLRSRIKEVKNE